MTYDDEEYNPLGYRRRKPADVPRGGMPVPGSDPLAGVPERDILPETYAEPDSLTRSMRYGPGDERGLSVPAPPPPAGWRPPSASDLPPMRPDPVAPRTPFADAPGESFADTVRRGAQALALAEREGLTTADMDYIRSYGRRAFDERNARYSAPATRADYLARQAGNLSVSVAERRAAQDELARLDRLAADERRREDWAAEQAALLDRARIAASAPVIGPGGVAAIPNATGGWDVSRPEPAPAAPPAPVSFGGGAGAIPEIGEDGQPTGRYVYQAPPTPDPNAAPWVPGGGATSVNRVTGDVKTAPGSAPDPNDPKNWRKVGSDIVNVVTNERISGYDARKALDDQIARLRVARANNALLTDAVAQIDAQIAELEAQKQTLGVADAQAPEAPEPTPASEQPAAPAPAAQAAPEASTPAASRTPSSVSAESVMPVNSKFRGSTLSLGTDGYLRVTMPDGSSFRPVYQTNRAGHLWLVHPDTGDAIFGGPIFGSAGPDEQKLVEALKDFYALPREKRRADSIEWKRVQLASQAMMKAGRVAERPAAPAQPAAPSSPTGRRRFED